MKISKSKQELARIINENGGWRGWTEWSVQNGDHGRISFSENKPERHRAKSWVARGGFQFKIEVYKPIRNWHQCILSREEYFHLYPEPDAKPKFCESVMRSIPEPKPTIEQLAADYRNAKDYAERKQEEADAANADADAKLKALELAGEAIGLLVSPITEKQEPELVITDWRQLRYGDFIWVASEDGYIVDGEYEVLELEQAEYDGTRAIRVERDGFRSYWINIENGWRFIRRP